MKATNWFKVMIFLRFYLFCLLAAFIVYGIVDFVRIRTADILITRANYQIIRETLDLLEAKYLSQKNNDAFDNKLKEVNEFSIYTVRIGNLADLNNTLSPDQYKRMLQGRIIFTQEDTALKKITGTNSAIFINAKKLSISARINDESAIEERVVIYELVLAALLVAVFSYLWLKPIWHDVVKIREKALLLSSGKLRTKIDETSSDIFKPIATALNDMVDKIQDATMMRRAMTNSMAHELRTPIARIRFHLHNYIETDEINQKKTIIDNIYQEINHVESLIEAALNYASIENYNKIISPQKQYISTWLDEKLDLFLIDSKNIKFIKKYESNLGWVFMDMNLMSHVLNNLLSNAKKYTKDTIQVSVNRTEEILIISVEDNGKGIALEDYNNIFKPFYRGQGSKKEGKAGFGVGLAIVHKIVALHRGKVYVRTSELGGACFVVEVPCHYQRQQ